MLLYMSTVDSAILASNRDQMSNGHCRLPLQVSWHPGTWLGVGDLGLKEEPGCLTSPSCRRSYCLLLQFLADPEVCAGSTYLPLDDQMYHLPTTCWSTTTAMNPCIACGIISFASRPYPIRQSPNGPVSLFINQELPRRTTTLLLSIRSFRYACRQRSGRSPHARVCSARSATGEAD